MILRTEKGEALTHNEMDENFKRANYGINDKKIFIDVTSERVLGVVYTNNNDFPLDISATIKANGVSSYFTCVLYIDSILALMLSANEGSTSSSAPFTFKIPSKSTYSLVNESGSPILTKFYELGEVV